MLPVFNWALLAIPSLEPSKTHHYGWSPGTKGYKKQHINTKHKTNMPTMDQPVKALLAINKAQTRHQRVLDCRAVFRGLNQVYGPNLPNPSDKSTYVIYNIRTRCAITNTIGVINIEGGHSHKLCSIRERSTREKKTNNKLLVLLHWGELKM